jgi:hypothetical protein
VYGSDPLAAGDRATAADDRHDQRASGVPDAHRTLSGHRRSGVENTVATGSQPDRVPDPAFEEHSAPWGGRAEPESPTAITLCHPTGGDFHARQIKDASPTEEKRMFRIRLFLVTMSCGAMLAGCPPEPKPNGNNNNNNNNGDEDTNEQTTPQLSTYEAFCNQLDECNSTLLEGMSASECADYFDDCTDDLLASEASDVEAAASECLSEYDSCGEFEDCYFYDVPYC